MEKLIGLMESCQELLTNCGEAFWSSKMKLLVNNYKLDGRDIRPTIRGWYGGMGSFNDLMISRYNGHAVSELDEIKFNKCLSELREEIYLEAK